MKLRIPTSTAVALGLLAGGLLAVASVKAQSGGTLTQQRTQSQNQLRSDQLSPGALQQERLMSQERIQSQQMLRDGAGPSGSAYQNQLQNQQRQQLQFQQRPSQGSGIPGGSASGTRMGTRGGRR
jgi:hypothetical protein